MNICYKNPPENQFVKHFDTNPTQFQQNILYAMESSRIVVIDAVRGSGITTALIAYAEWELHNSPEPMTVEYVTGRNMDRFIASQLKLTSNNTLRMGNNKLTLNGIDSVIKRMRGAVPSELYIFDIEYWNECRQINEILHATHSWKGRHITHAVNNFSFFDSISDIYDCEAFKTTSKIYDGGRFVFVSFDGKAVVTDLLHHGIPYEDIALVDNPG